jgi:CHAT domain-containing protein
LLLIGSQPELKSVADFLVLGGVGFGMLASRDFSLCWRRSIVASIVLLVFSCACRRATDAERLLTEADCLALLCNWPRAAHLFAQAEARFRESGDRSKVLYARLGYLWATADTGANSAANAEIDRAVRDPLAEKDSRLMLRCFVAKAARERVVNEASARASWEKVLNLAKALDDKRWQARAQAEIGEIRYLDGDVEAAIQMFKQALLSQYTRLDLGAAIYYTSLVGNGMVEAGQPAKGLLYCATATRLASVVKDGGFPFLAYQGKARALIALHRSPEAKPVLSDALARARTEGNRHAEAQLLIVAGYGEEEHGKAIHHLKAANALSEAGGFNHVYTWSAMELAKRYISAGDLESAERYAIEGLGAMPDLQDKYHLPQHVALLAELKAKRGKVGEANRLYERAADVIDGLLVTAHSRQTASTLLSTLSDVYLGHFELAAAMMRDTAKAYEIIEEARGRTLADALRDERRSETTSDPVSLSAQRQIHQIQLMLLRETDRAERQNLLDRLFETEQLFTPIRRPTSPLQAVVTHSKPAPLSSLQARLDPDEVVLEYVLSEPRSFCIRITPTHASVVVLRHGRRRIEQAVDEHLAEIRTKALAVGSGRQLYAMLLEPVLQRYRASRLIVVPDGKLNFLPVDSLVDPEGRRLIESYTVSYCPSATVLHLMRSVLRRTPGLRFLGVGDVQYAPANGTVQARAKGDGVPAVRDFLRLDVPDRLADIPHTRDEIIAASQAIGKPSTLLVGRDATEAAVKSQPLESFGVIHLATHGVASSEFPDRAALVLAPDPRGSEDGLLQAREIRNLPLRAELLTLSACETGFGSLEGQEGVANLVRAFLFAGTKSVVASVWMASDVFTAHLMRRFYGHLSKGTDRSVALQRAKIDSMREFGWNAVPFYWAGFVMVGDGLGCIVCPEPSAAAHQVPQSR